MMARILLKRTMGQGIDPRAHKFSLQMRIPVVLYLVIRSSWQTPSYQRPLISKEGVQFENKIVFVFRKIPSFQIRAKIIYPSQPATLTTPKQTCGLGERAPATLSMSLNILDKPLILFFGPSSFVSVTVGAARRSSHLFNNSCQKTKMDGAKR
jgi:hypothetical protein